MTQYEIMELAKQAGFLTHPKNTYIISKHASADEDLSDELEAFAKLVAAKEREACAKICDDELKEWGIFDSDVGDCAIAIRARGEKK